jgi:hypothetical protein
VDIAGAVVDNTSSALWVQTPGQHPHSHKYSDESGVTSVGIAFESTIKVTEEQHQDDLRTLDNYGEANHMAELTYDCNEHVQIHVMNERAPDQVRGFLIGVDHYGNSEDFISSLTDDEDDDDKVAQQQEALLPLKEGDKEDAFLVKEAGSSEIHSVVHSRTRIIHRGCDFFCC